MSFNPLIKLYNLLLSRKCFSCIISWFKIKVTNDYIIVKTFRKMIYDIC